MGLLQKKREQSDRAVTKEELLLMERIVELRREVSDLRGQLKVEQERANKLQDLVDIYKAEGGFDD